MSSRAWWAGGRASVSGGRGAEAEARQRGAARTGRETPKRLPRRDAGRPAGMEAEKMDENEWRYHGEGNKSLVVSHRKVTAGARERGGKGGASLGAANGCLFLSRKHQGAGGGSPDAPAGRFAFEPRRESPAEKLKSAAAFSALSGEGARGNWRSISTVALRDEAGRWRPRLPSPPPKAA